MRRIPTGVSLAALVLVVGCVVIPDTFNADITVTIRHIEEQADQILDYVEGKTDSLPGLEDGDTENTSFLMRTIQFMNPIQVAYAAEEVRDSSPRVTQIANSMKARYNEVRGIKATGAVGENNRGLLKMERANLIADSEERNQAQRVVAAENDDRKALYQEIARLNRDQDLNVGQVERIYAQERLERAKAGEYFELPPAGSDFNAFKSSSAGQRLGAQCVPGAWVTIK